jgi:hypothetical protein
VIRPVFSQFVPGRVLPHGPRQGALVSLPAVPPPPVVPLGPAEHMVLCSAEAGQNIDQDDPHAGSPDLTRFPASLAEQHLAAEILAGTDRYVELLEVTGSTNRRLAVLFMARGGLS